MSASPVNHMRQLLGNNRGVAVARMPRPIAGPGAVLVRVHYSLVSVGTELAAFRASSASGGTGDVRGQEGAAARARRYLLRAVQDPRKAAARVAKIAGSTGQALWAKYATPAPSVVIHGDIRWTAAAAKQFQAEEGRLDITTDESPALYQAVSQPISVAPNCVPKVRLKGCVHEGSLAIGLLNEAGDRWLVSRTFGTGPIDDELVAMEIGNSKSVTVVIANAGGGRAARLGLDHADVVMEDPSAAGAGLSDLADQGWNLGYSVAGRVVATGPGVTDLAAGDWVACGGAGQANHADYVAVQRNLVCRIPKGCDVRWAATTTVGAIALQGVRRAAPQLGERICVLGLGLIGQLTVQMLRANGCVVLGHDLDERRIERARHLGMDQGDHDLDRFRRIVRDATQGWGGDRTIITAATKSDAVINLAMELTRPKGTVVIVGDVGLKVERVQFYRKEIDLLMSTSYGPGRYDRAYEEYGRDYPYPYVRWTMNRNMQAYLDLAAGGRLNLDALIDKVIDLDEAPGVYKTLAEGKGELPLGVLLRYGGDDPAASDTLPPSTITIGGHKKVSQGPSRFLLVGVGGFGTGMLVPQMQKHPRLFAMRGVVSRDTTRGGNFARENRIELLGTNLHDHLQSADIDLIVIATRHDDHADKVCASLAAGKHVFVEKPLALTWQELERVDTTYRSVSHPPLLMVGFNRRFAPAMRRLNDLLRNRRSPLMVNYRLHGGYIPLDHWVQGSQGGGRNLGEACHMYDVFRCLASAPVMSIEATAIDPGVLPYARSDNFSATLRYADGSVCSLLYTALGPKQGLPKERIEVFCDGEAYVIDDFKSLVRSSDGTTLWQGEQDKGHGNELEAFGRALHGETEVPIPFDQLIETSAVALHIEDLLYGRTHDDT